MSRKKPRTAPRSPGTITADQPAARPNPAPVAVPARAVPTVAVTPFFATPLGRVLRRLFRIASSLQLAIILLSTFAATLGVATKLESDYSTSVAQNLVYRTWWFALLLTLLAVNILCAALKKYPWKKYQTGFLITHMGLEVLVFGGLLTALFGAEGMMNMVDTSSEELQSRAGAPQQRQTMAINDQHTLEVVRVRNKDLRDKKVLRALYTMLREDGDLSSEEVQDLGSHYHAFTFNPGSFAWHADKYFQPRLPLGLQLLKVLADPYPRYQATFDNSTQLVVENYYPHAEEWPITDAAGQQGSFPAMRLRLKEGEQAQTTWLLGCVSQQPSQSDLNLDMMALEEPALLDEFLNPPASDAANMGKDGQLVVAVGSGKDSKLFRIPVDRSNLAGHDLPGTGLHVELQQWSHLSQLDDAEGIRELRDDAARRPPEEYPTLKLEVRGPRGTGTYLACARLPQRSGLQSGTSAGAISFWYHYPDFRWGRPQTDAPETLQFLQGPDDRVYYRFFSGEGLARKGRPLDTAADAAAGAEPHSLPSDRPLSFQVVVYKPSVIARPSYVPQNVTPGVESDTLLPTLRFTLSSTGSKPQEAWIQMRRPKKIMLGDDIYLMRYRHAVQLLDFALKLKRAREVKDPGSDRAAAFESEVTLIPLPEGDKRSDHLIYMNNPLDYGRYKVYQANYLPLKSGRRRIKDESGHSVSLSGLQVSYDPGLWFKYAGSLIVVAGIFTMFYMKAYFFKPRGGQRVPVPSDANPVQT